MSYHDNVSPSPPLDTATGLCASLARTPMPRRLQTTSPLPNELHGYDSALALTAEDERRLAWSIINDGCAASRDRIVLANRGLVQAIVRNYLGRGLACTELIERGNVGLVHAAESFDPAHGARFSTWASWWIKQAMKEARKGNSFQSRNAPDPAVAMRDASRLPHKGCGFHHLQIADTTRVAFTRLDLRDPIHGDRSNDAQRPSDPVRIPLPGSFLLALVALLVGAAATTACSTTEGFGEDVKHLGGSIEGSAKNK